MKSFSLVACLLLLPAAGTPPLDPAASKAASKELKSAAKAATQVHRGQLVDATVAMLDAIEVPFVAAGTGTLDAAGVATMLEMLDGFQVDVQQAGRFAAEMLAVQIPQELQLAFGDIDLEGQLPLGYRPGDGGVLDDFRAQSGKDGHTVFKLVLKAFDKLGKLVEKHSGTALRIELAEPAVPWIAGNEDAWSVGDQQHLTLDVVLVVRGGGDIGRRVLLAGSAADADGQLTVSLRQADDTELDSATPTPVDGRWTATFAAVGDNPILVRVSRGGATLVERMVGIP